MLVIGSQNSSNSLRLTEISKAVGTPAHLIDDTKSINKEWFNNVKSVLVTAGASAPEHLVEEVVEYLITNHEGKLEDNSLVDEGMSFSMPASFKHFIESRNITIEGELA